MNIQFDTTSTNETETRALIALLSALLPTPNGQTKVGALVLAPTAALLGQLNASLADLQQAEQQLQAMQQIQTAVGSTTPGPVLVGGAEPTKRTRRTKEQIAADAAKAEAERVAQEGHPEEAEYILQEAETPAQVVNGAVKVISADELRALLNGYIHRHNMEKAIDILKSYGCNRVTEALALESVKLNELAAVLNG